MHLFLMCFLKTRKGENIKHIKFSICLVVLLILFLSLGGISSTDISGDSQKESVEIQDNGDLNENMVLYENTTVSNDKKLDTVEDSHKNSKDTANFKDKNLKTASKNNPVPKNLETKNNKPDNTITGTNSKTDILKEDNLTDISISAEDLTMKRYDGSLFIVKVKCSNEKVIGKYIKITINNKTYWRPINNNYQANMTIYFGIGNYTSECSFNYTGYTPSRCSARIQVNDNKLKTSLKGNNITMYYQDGSSYFIELKDENGQALSNKTIHIKINDRTYYKRTDTSGIATLIINYAPGNYIIEGTYNGDYNHTGSSTRNNLTIYSYTTKMESSNITMYYANGTQLIGRLTDMEGIGIKDSYIHILIGDRTYYRKTNDEGKVNLSVNLKAGDYKTTILFNGSRGYLPSNITVSINVLNITSRITSYNISGEYGDDAILTAHIENQNGEAIVNGYVKVLINNRTYWRNTNSTGDINISLNSLYVGNYDAIITFSGSTGVSPSNGTLVIRIKPKDIMIVSLGATIRRNGTYKVEVSDYNGRKIKKCPLTFKINNRTYYRSTDNNGIASITLNLSNNLYDIIVTASKNYRSNTLYETIDIVK